MIVDFRRNPPLSPTHHHEQHCDCSGVIQIHKETTISQNLKWDNHIESMVKKAQQRLYFLRQLSKFNLPQELLKQFYSDIIETILYTSITVWFSSATKSNLRRLRKNHWCNPPHSQRTHPEWAKELTKSPWTPHIQHTPSLNCYRLVDATELWAPERPDTGTVSFLRQSISWTLDIKRNFQNSFQICTCQTSHIIVCIVYCFFYFVQCLFVYCSFVVRVLSCCCHSVALWSFCHCN